MALVYILYVLAILVIGAAARIAAQIWRTKDE